MKKINLTDDNFNKLGKLKKSTVRLGIRDYTVGRTEIVNVDSGATTPCLIRSVKLMTIRDLDHRHALRDGFHSLGELFKELRKHYGLIKPDDWVTVVNFDACTPTSER
ncbi:ASCH domain protein [Vibrio phage 1.089.O._10N.261.51.F9]|nr:ASCH domain protein [Vibrio phage 1.012.O._10N.261.48.C12]AUR86770.1 ASCH domain protein [Vibrio phage 1.089.O._10N.261.51.F9]AUR87276.1 ASCH domain protein [Vibrio phage 1.098.O._10N.286.51.B9]AUR91383.1 ASCH domain protein [Vibrio phage 1.160.O._10N.261.48.B11]AUR97091.1 ASCH domain protein [Vibrio phage 1.237.A._10N.261.52.C5]AUR97186.1 ASCH domain protein [Vibrio phage 1.237.B._10N.261.52.C5]